MAEIEQHCPFSSEVQKYVSELLPFLAILNPMAFLHLFYLSWKKQHIRFIDRHNLWQSSTVFETIVHHSLHNESNLYDYLQKQIEQSEYIEKLSLGLKLILFSLLNQQVCNNRRFI